MRQEFIKLCPECGDPIEVVATGDFRVLKIRLRKKPQKHHRMPDGKLVEVKP